jgi:hypothetical protein
MSSHNGIHMCSVPYQSHMHTETSSVRSYKTIIIIIIQSYAMHAHDYAHSWYPSQRVPAGGLMGLAQSWHPSQRVPVGGLMGLAQSWHPS